MSLALNHTVRALDQEIDAIEICPGHPDHLVIGTYSLLKNEPCSTREDYEETISDAETQHRVGSIQVLSIEESNDTVLNNDSVQSISRRNFPCAVLDIRFHPKDDTLLGIATSTGHLQFFRFVWHRLSNQADTKSVEILPLGIIKIYNEDEDETKPLPLITQFSWINVKDSLPSQTDPATMSRVYLATCDTTGQANIMSVQLPSDSSLEALESTGNADRDLAFQIENVHKHLYNLEAWTVSSIALKNDSTTSNQMILSGGDDSCLIASLCTIQTSSEVGDEMLGNPPLRIFLDKRTHTAGVVSTLPLDTTSNDTTILLTGSYDQYLRLHLLDSNMSISHVSEVQLEGGVWRISLMDKYTNDSSHSEHEQNWILLVSAMHAGCYIIRLTAKRGDEDQTQFTDWCWKIEQRFREPHESMVYASAATLRDPGKSSGAREWTVISTSFYDKRVCVWEWTDLEWPRSV